MRAPKRDVTSFYWLKADKSVNKGLIEASFNAETNTFVLHPSSDLAGDFSILINPRMVDVSRPVTFETPKGSFTITVAADAAALEDSLREVNDPFLAWVQEISYAKLVAAADEPSGTAGEPAGAGHESVVTSMTAPVSAAQAASTVPKTGDEVPLALVFVAALSLVSLVASSVPKRSRSC